MKADNTFFNSSAGCDPGAIHATRRNAALTVALVTPWKQVCGNARYAEKLATGLARHAVIEPVQLTPQPFEANHFERLAQEINEVRADVVHVQHEYCFFGSGVASANYQLDQLLAKIEAPLTITLHTVREDLLGERSLSSPMAQRVYARFRRLCHQLRLSFFHRLQRYVTKRLRRFDAMLRALGRCQTIVVHSQVRRSA